jgi:hypothetical protein
MKRFFPVWTLLVCAALMSGCGYELVKEKGIYGGEISSIYLPVFKNNSFEPLASGVFTQAFSMEMAGSGLFQLNKADADATLQGNIMAVTTSPGPIGATGQTVQKVVSANISLTLTKQGKRLKTWSFSDSDVYDASTINIEEPGRRAALQRIAMRIARRFHIQVLSVY